MNTVTIVGRLGQDPEIKYFESGSIKTRFSVAVDRGTKDNKVTDWFNIEAWGRLGEFAGEWLKKGSSVAVVGTLEINRWTDQAGNLKETPLIRATDIRFVGSKRDSMSTGAGMPEATVRF